MQPWERYDGAHSAHPDDCISCGMGNGHAGPREEDFRNPIFLSQRRASCAVCPESLVGMAKAGQIRCYSGDKDT